jgi:uncharacterized membrane protein YciS (DUF1049 family)
MKSKKPVLVIVLLASVLALAIAPGALANSTPVLTTIAQAAPTTAQAATAAAQAAPTIAQAASTIIQASLFIAGLVVGLLFFGLVRTADVARIKRHHLAVGVSRQVTEQRQHTRHKHVIHV